MAVDLVAGNTTRYYTIPHADALDLASTGWAVFIWSRIEDNAGTDLQYIISTASASTVNGACLVWMNGDSAVDPGTWHCAVRDDAGVNTGVLVAGTVTGADSLNRLLVFQYNGSGTVSLWTCTPGGTPLQLVSSSTTLGNATVPNNWHIGARTDLSTTRFYHEHLAGFGKANRAFSTGEIAALASGVPPLQVLGSSLVGWWPFFEPVATVKDIIGANDATQAGTGWATAEHFPLRLGVATQHVRAQTGVFGAVAPDFLLTATNLTGAVTDIDDDPDSPGADWLTATVGTSGIDLLVRFPMPEVGATLTGAQDFKTYLRKTSGAANQTVDVELHEYDGVGDVDLAASYDFVAILSDDLSITSEAGQLDTHNWNASQLTDPTRSVAIRIVGGGT